MDFPSVGGPKQACSPGPRRAPRTRATLSIDRNIPTDGARAFGRGPGGGTLEEGMPKWRQEEATARSASRSNPRRKRLRLRRHCRRSPRRDLEQSGDSVPERAGPRECCPAAPPMSPDRDPGTCSQSIHATSLQKNAALIATPTEMTPALTIHAGRAFATGAPR